MTTRRHSLLAAALALPLLVGLVACGGDDDDDAATSDSAATTEADAAETTETTEAPAADGDAAGEAVATVFDSSVAFDDKVAMIENGESHRADHEGYVAAADQVGGITLEPTDVSETRNDAATVTYRVLFGGNEAYADLTMDVTQVDGEWVVPSEAFCGFLASARTPCAGDAGAGAGGEGGAPTETTVGG